jgi:signal transduction histidine kinase
MVSRSPHELSGQQRAERSLVRAYVFLRLAQYLPSGVAAVFADPSVYLHRELVLGLYFAAAAWSVLLLVAALLGWPVKQIGAVIDVVFISGTLVVVGRSIAPGHGLQWAANWTFGPAVGAALLAVVFGRRSLAVPSVALLTACYLLGVWPALVDDPSGPGAAAANIGSLILFSAVGGIGPGWLRSSARSADEAHQSAIEAQRGAAEAAARIAAAEARDQERVRQYRHLHDNVLTTLTVGAIGQIDLNAEDFRAQCDRDARYLRALITGLVDAVPTDLGTDLARIVRDMEVLGLRIDQNAAGLPATIPSHVTDALLGATREALNNARKHACTKRAWLTALGDGAGGITITVVDRGRGFVPDSVQGGYGLLGSIRHRVIEARGQCDIISTPGEGTTVEISWKP